MKDRIATVLVTVTTAVVSLALTWPRETSAREVSMSERQGEWDDDGARFGDVVVKGDLVADERGWVLVRKLENKGEARAKCTVEERLLRTETMLDARIEPAPFVVINRTQTFELAPHEKRAIGIPLPAAVSAEISAAVARGAAIQLARDHAIASQDFHNRAVFEQTYMRYDVGYIKPLATGDTPADEGTGAEHPAVMPFL